MTKAVEQLEQAVNALKDKKASEEALTYLKDQIDRLNDLVPFIITSGGDMTEVKQSAKKLMKTLGIDSATKSSSIHRPKKETCDWVEADVKKWCSKNAKGKGNAKSKGEIEAGVLGSGKCFKLHQWNDHKNDFLIPTGEAPAFKYHV